MDIVHVAAWIVVIFFGLVVLQACLGEPLLSYVLVGTAGLGIIGFMTILAVAFWDSIGRFVILLGATALIVLLYLLLYHLAQLTKALARRLRNRFTGSPNSEYLRQ